MFENLMERVEKTARAYGRSLAEYQVVVGGNHVDQDVLNYGSAEGIPVIDLSGTRHTGQKQARRCGDDESEFHDGPPQSLMLL